GWHPVGLRQPSRSTTTVWGRTGAARSKQIFKGGPSGSLVETCPSAGADGREPQGNSEACVSARPTEATPPPAVSTGRGCPSGGGNCVPVGAVVEGGCEGSWDRA